VKDIFLDRHYHHPLPLDRLMTVATSRKIQFASAMGEKISIQKLIPMTKSMQHQLLQLLYSIIIIQCNKNANQLHPNQSTT
jgi:hypothetical protein